MRLFKFKHNDGEDAIPRIVNSIVCFSHRDGAREIYLESQPQALAVYYTINGEKKLWMDLPIYVLKPVIEHIKKLAAIGSSDSTGLICVRMEDKNNQFRLNYNLRVQVNASPGGEELVLSFEDEYMLE